MTVQLKRELGVFGAMMMGLGSMVGTGVFVSIGIGAGVTGASVIVAIMVAAGVATANALNSAQLAANHPVSGGTYEYGYRYLTPRLGFTAGWLFLLAKSASAATAALGFSGYLLDFLDADADDLLVPIALGAVIALTAVVLLGIRRSNLTNIAIVSATILALGLFVVAGVGQFEGDNLDPFFTGESNGGVGAFLQACALMFVAYTGYGRIATLGEEVKNPRQTIPRAIVLTLLVTMTLYSAVAIIAVGTVGADVLSAAVDGDAAPLEVAARQFSGDTVATVVGIGAMTAMLGVLLNLILGLSRVLLAMGRRRDMPPATATLNAAQTTPTVAVVVMGAVVGGLVLVGDVKTTWSFSAFNVLLYYALTNLSALQLSADERLFPRWVAFVGLGACFFLSFWVSLEVWLFGVALLGVGQVWHEIAKRAFHAGSG